MKLKKLSSALVAACLTWNLSFPAFALNSSETTQVKINAEEILFNTSDLRSALDRALKDQKVLDQLAQQGASAAEVKTRLAAMSDQELQQVLQGTQRQVGGDVVVISLTTLLIIILIVLLLR